MILYKISKILISQVQSSKEYSSLATHDMNRIKEYLQRQVNLVMSCSNKSSYVLKKPTAKSCRFV